MTDIHRAIARVHAGECPLCGSRLVMDADFPHDTDLAFVGWAWCKPCVLAFTISSVRDPVPTDGEAYGGMGPMLTVSRKLSHDERMKLFAGQGDGA